MAAPKRLGFTAAVCAVFVAGMVGASFAAVPLYRIFCQVTGFNGTTQRAEAAPGRTLDREITVRFDANVGNGLGWSFRPLERTVKVKLGEIGSAAYVARNRSGITQTGSASFNVAPLDAGVYFNKIECFCFTDNTLADGETADLPLTFFIDPALADDPDFANLDSITLSYTFYPAAPAAKPVASSVGARAVTPGAS